MNRVILLGRLARDPEIRYSQAAEPIAVARYTLAVNRQFKRDEADFVPCVSFGKAAEFAQKYFKKGQQVAVEGRIQVRSYDDQNGQKKWTTEVIVENQYFAEGKQSSGGGYDSVPMPEPPTNYSAAPKAPRQSSAPTPAPTQDFYTVDDALDDEDLPF